MGDAAAGEDRPSSPVGPDLQRPAESPG